MIDPSMWERQELSLLSDCNIHQVLSCLIHRFQLDHGSLPEVVYLNSNLKMGFVVELITVYKLQPEAAVLEPVWLEGFGKAIPLLYSTQLGEDYAHLINSKINAVNTL